MKTQKLRTDTVIVLRGLNRSDLPMLLKWRNSRGVLNYVREYRLLDMADQINWYGNYLESRRKADWGQELMVVCEQPLHSDPVTPIGVGGFVRIQLHHGRAEISFYIGETKYRTKQIIKESLAKLLEMGFNQLRFNKITWPVYSHDPNLETYKSIIPEEAVLKQEYFWDGKFNDRHYLSITAHQYQEKRAEMGQYLDT